VPRLVMVTPKGLELSELHRNPVVVLFAGCFHKVIGRELFFALTTTSLTALT